MRIFLYEFVTGGGWYCEPTGRPPDSLLAEGAAMLRSVAADFRAIPGIEVDVMRDRRYRVSLDSGATIHQVASAADEAATLSALASAADWTVMIAPEFSGHLRARCQAVELAGGKLLGPSSDVVALVGDKHAAAEHLAAHGVSVPWGVALAAEEALPARFPYPAVLKPRDGAGSQGIESVEGPGELDSRWQHRQAYAHWRLEEFRVGLSASVACLCGPRRIVPLVPCRQRLGEDGGFEYLGGSLPLDAPLAARARRLAARAIAALDCPLGYLGVDLVLGHDATGADDVAIEINPRLTTSYVGLRALARGNLAEAMLEIARGNEVELCWQERSIQFESGGCVRDLTAPGGV